MFLSKPCNFLYKYQSLLKLYLYIIMCLPGHKFQSYAVLLKSQFLYLRSYFAVVSASAVKSTEPSSLLDFFFVMSLTWQTEKIPCGCPATGTWAFWSYQGLARGEGWVCWPDGEEMGSEASPVPRKICQSFKSYYQNSWTELDALI